MRPRGRQAAHQRVSASFQTTQICLRRGAELENDSSGQTGSQNRRRSNGKDEQDESVGGCGDSLSTRMELSPGTSRSLIKIAISKNGGGGGSRTPVRKALRHEAYMLSSIPFCSPATLRMSKKRSRLVRWFSPEPYGPKGSGQLTV